MRADAWPRSQLLSKRMCGSCKTGTADRRPCMAHASVFKAQCEACWLETPGM